MTSFFDQVYRHPGFSCYSTLCRWVYAKCRPA